jgi:hypothetical protein
MRFAGEGKLLARAGWCFYTLGELADNRSIRIAGNCALIRTIARNASGCCILLHSQQGEREKE